MAGDGDEIFIGNPGLTLNNREIQRDAGRLLLLPGEGARFVGVDIEGSEIEDVFFADDQSISKRDNGYLVRVNDRLSYEVVLSTGTGDPTTRAALAEVRLTRRPGRDDADSIQTEFGFVAQQKGVVDVHTLVRIDGDLERTGRRYTFYIVDELPK